MSLRQRSSQHAEEHAWESSEDQRGEGREQRVSFIAFLLRLWLRIVHDEVIRNICNLDYCADTQFSQRGVGALGQRQGGSSTNRRETK
jgi:hypothetical protein